MPIHPVTIILGTTLAIVGGGYAFKKFVYDPHLAPFVEAIIAAHQAPPRRRAVPIPASSEYPLASSSARQDRASELRRRRRSSDLRTKDVYVDEVKRGPSIDRRGLMEDHWGRQSAYELKESIMAPASPFADENEYRRTPPRLKSKLSDPDLHPLVDLESPESSRSPRRVLFQAPITPASSTFMQPGHANQPTENDITPTGSPVMDNSVFSLISSSPAASPSISQRILSDDAADQWANVPRLEAQSLEDVLSLPDTTTTSGYEDAEAYSPMSGSGPQRIHIVSPGSPPRTEDSSLPRLSASIAFSEISAPREVAHTRGPMSVVSLSESESEGWTADSDWGRTSDAGF